MKHLFVLFTFIVFGFQSWAEVRIAIDTNVIQDSKDLSTSTNTTQTFYDGSLKAQLAWGGNLYLGIGYLHMTTTEPVSTTQQYTIISTNPYAGFSFYFGTGQLFSLEANWMPSVTADYTQTGSSSNELWTGTGYYGKLSVQPEITPYFSVNLSIAYFSANYSSKSATTAITTKSSFTRTFVAPMIGFQFIF